MRNDQYNCQMALDHLVAEMNQNNDLNDILEELVSIYPDCESNLRETAKTWEDLNELNIPHPTQSMHNNFYHALKNYEAPNSSSKLVVNQAKRFRFNVMQLAAAIALLLGGVFIGRFMFPNDTSTHFTEVQSKAMEEPELIFAGSSAINRLEKVHNSKNIENPDQIVFDALNQVLLSDQNINVRLSAIEALLHFADYPDVRTYLIQAIPLQESPIVQIALADAMRALQEKNSVDKIQQLIESGELDLEVKDYYEKTIKEIM